MNPDIGRFLEGRTLPMIKLLVMIHDVGLGVGYDTSSWVDGRELVVGRGEERMTKGFIRVIPQETLAILCFPKGHQLFDPKKRAKGPPGSQTRIIVRDPSDVDLYVRRLIEEAYCMED